MQKCKANAKYLMKASERVRARCHWVWHRIEKVSKPFDSKAHT